jgi:tetratricopeptide (TPR) repeat protein
LQHVDRLPAEVAIRLRLALLSLHVHSNQWLRRSHDLEAQLSRVALTAQQRGMHAEAARSYYLLSFVHSERGDFGNAGDVSLQAAAHAGRAVDRDTRQLQLANTGRCLALIERDIARADGFLRDAEALGSDAPVRTKLEIVFGRGLVHAYRGNEHEAVPLLERAAELAAAEAEHWTQAQALTRIARIALEHGRPHEAVSRCAELEPLVAKLSEGSEGPFVQALHAIARLELGDPDGRATAERAVEALRAIDSKGHVAYVLNALAAYDALAARPDEALRRAEEALRCAETVGQQSEVAVARARLALCAHERDDPQLASAWLEAYGSGASHGQELSARAKTAVTAAASRLGRRAAIS